MVPAQQKTQQLWWVCKEAAVEKGAGHCPEGSARFFFNSIFFLFYSGGEVTRVKSRCGRTGKLMESGYMMCYSQRINFLKLNKKRISC